MVHRAAKCNFLKNSLTLPKSLKSTSVQVSRDLFLANEGVCLKNLWWLFEETQTLFPCNFSKAIAWGFHFSFFCQVHSTTPSLFHSSIYFPSLSTHYLTSRFLKIIYPHLQIPFSKILIANPQTLIAIPKLPYYSLIPYFPQKPYLNSPKTPHILSFHSPSHILTLGGKKLQTS